MKRRDLIGVGVFLVAAAGVLLLPQLPWVSDFRSQQFAYVGIYFVALLGLNLLTGITGQISLGHGAFMLIGGYTTAILMSEQDPPLELLGHQFTGDMRDIWTIPLAGLVAGVAGFLFGFPALRLTGLYLALATFAVAVAAPAVVKKYEGFTGGGGGINLFEAGTRTKATSITDPVTFEEKRIPISILGIDIPTFNEWLYYLCWTIALVMFAAAWLLLRGRFGRSLRAVRDSELAAASSGVNLARYKTLAFGISAFYAGVAGALWTYYLKIANYEHFTLVTSVQYLAMIIIGGLGSVLGSVFGAVFITMLPIVLVYVVEGMAGVFGFKYAVIADFLANLRLIIFGGLIILFLAIEPEGLYRMWGNVKRYFRLWPFSY